MPTVEDERTILVPNVGYLTLETCRSCPQMTREVITSSGVEQWSVAKIADEYYKSRYDEYFSKEYAEKISVCQHSGEKCDIAELYRVIVGPDKTERWSPKSTMEYAVYCATDKEYYAQNYAKEVLIQCEGCGAWFSKETPMERVIVDYDRENQTYIREQWCNDCVGQNTTVCEDCGAIFSDDYDHRWIRDGRGDYFCLCEECYNNREDICYCERCDDYVLEDYYDFDNDCCEDCAADADEEIRHAELNSSLITSYHSSSHKYKKNNDFVFGADEPHDNEHFVGLGIELEVDNGDDPAKCAQQIEDSFPGHFVYEHDGSLGDFGFEIISKPHTINAFYEIDWEKLLKLIKDCGYTSHDSGTCGLHIHISRNMFWSYSHGQAEVIAFVLKFYDLYWDDLLKLSRRRDIHYCQSIENLYSFDDYLRYAESSGESRYKCINLENSNTVEFRLGRGTLKSTSFLAWIDLNLTLVRNAHRIALNYSSFSDFPEEVSNPREMLKGLNKTTLTYMQEKHVTFGGVFTCVSL